MLYSHLGVDLGRMQAFATEHALDLMHLSSQEDTERMLTGSAIQDELRE